MLTKSSYPVWLLVLSVALTSDLLSLTSTSSTVLVSARKSASRSKGGSSSSRRSSRPSSSSRSRRPATRHEEEDIVDFGGLVEDEDEDEEESDDVYNDEESEEEDAFADYSLGDANDHEYDNDGYDSEEVLEPLPPRRSSRSGGQGPPPPRKSRQGPPPKRSNRPPPPTPKSRKSKGGKQQSSLPQSRRGSAGSRRRAPPTPQGRGRRGGKYSKDGRRGSSRRSGTVVPYVNRASSAAFGTFTRGLTAIRESMPDPADIKDKATASVAAAKERTGKYVREFKGMLSSELEQVLLKATRPDDTPVKAKHVERLIGVTYQISGQYDLYDPILRKLWSKMTEPDWRSNTKALYVLHRFSADGAPDHQASLKARLRELRRTKDPKRKDAKYFNSKQLLAGKATPENAKYRAFMARYAHFVLLRAQCFGGMFCEIAPTESSKSSKKSQKSVTSTALRSEHLDAAKLILKAGCACLLKEGEDCEITATAMERVAIDMAGLTKAVAIALNKAIKGSDTGANPSLIKQWCEFYSNDLLPQTKSLLKKSSATLDGYGIFLPSRMGATVSQEILEKGLQCETEEKSQEDSAAAEKVDEDVETSEVKEEEDEATVVEQKSEECHEEKEETPSPALSQPQPEEDDDEYLEEYEYDEYYDDEEL